MNKLPLVISRNSLGMGLVAVIASSFVGPARSLATRLPHLLVKPKIGTSSSEEMKDLQEKH